MTTTISKVTNRAYDEGNVILLRKYCQQSADKGGTFSIVTSYNSVEGCMITTYTINWPNGLEGSND
jgi:hypothetical protein